ncbi:HAD family hydrolase [Paenibacillus aurantius]|uniref:HAD family hydrolase n=2 Tax=Paenibacillus aurantius TaxID=2918900 RepID=A0AA96RGF4_9BACL|nr:HAD family hydrolase [Paenibacillus aurantius]WNQ12283.1 HAD family hydrolase [Paenibacillus aurantius]
MDDTILSFDHGLDLDACWMAACVTHLAGMEAGMIEQAVMTIKRQAKEYWSDAERHRTGRLDLPKARKEIIEAALHELKYPNLKCAARIATDYGAARDLLVTLFPGAVETIQQIKTMGIPVALITNGASLPQREKINKFALGSLFEHIFIEEEFGIGKPEPAIYQHVMDLLGTAPEETWMVGDNYEWEVAAPQKLGMKGIWVDHKGVHGTQTLPVPPYRSIRALPELLPLF